MDVSELLVARKEDSIDCDQSTGRSSSNNGGKSMRRLRSEVLLDSLNPRVNEAQRNSRILSAKNREVKATDNRYRASQNK